MKKLAIILGANGDLGSELIGRIPSKDCAIIGIDKTQNLTKHISFLLCNLSDHNQIISTLNQIDFSHYKHVTVISSVGLFKEPSFLNSKFNHKAFIESIEANLVGVCNFVAESVQRCLANNIHTIRIVIVGSAASQAGSLDLGYGVAKSGLNGFVRSFSKALSSLGVICIGVNPGVFESKMAKSVSQQRQKKAINDTHIKRMGSLDEIANFVMYIAFDAPDHLTGSTLSISGGQCA